MMHSKTFLLSG